MGIRPLDDGDIDEIVAGFDAFGWNKPRALFERYLDEQRGGVRMVWVATIGGGIAGYLTVAWLSDYPPFRDAGIPEIVDLNAYPQFRRQGVARALIETAQRLACTRSETIGIGFGIGAEYGPAQRLYVRNGYLPDGQGVMYNGVPVGYSDPVLVDDSATLTLTKRIRSDQTT